MKIYLLGATGQVGFEIQKLLGDTHEILTDPVNFAFADEIKAILRQKPDLVINAAAYTDVEDCQGDGKLQSYIANDLGPSFLIKYLSRSRDKPPLIHFSTDYVFDGSKDSPYTVTDKTGPLQAYGVHKLNAERKVLSYPNGMVLRTSWVYSDRRKNFVNTMAGLFTTRETVTVVNDQFGVPTSAKELARAVQAVLVKGFRPGLFHVTGGGEPTSWYGFASEIHQQIQGREGVILKELLPCTTVEYPTKAVRPLNSVLSTKKFEKAFKYQPRDWKKELKDLFGSDE